MATAIKTDPGMDYHSGSGKYMFDPFMRYSSYV
jgi:hypothetical protein